MEVNMSSVNSTNNNLDPLVNQSIPTETAEAESLALQALQQGANNVSSTNNNSAANAVTAQQTAAVASTDDGSEVRSFAGKARTMGKVLGGHASVAHGGASGVAADASSSDYQQWLVQQQAIQYQQQQQDIRNQQSRVKGL
jgi:hypothetical protein